MILRGEYEKHSASKAALSFLRLDQLFYEHIDKAGNLLAWKIKQLEFEIPF